MSSTTGSGIHGPLSFVGELLLDDRVGGRLEREALVGDHEVHRLVGERREQRRRGAASRSTMFGVLRSFALRFTCELTSWYAFVIVPATTERSSGSSSKTGMSVGRSVFTSAGKMRR